MPGSADRGRDKTETLSNKIETEENEEKTNAQMPEPIRLAGRLIPLIVDCFLIPDIQGE